jgi:drug/metabolite transporter (DMT)-like permease
MSVAVTLNYTSPLFLALVMPIWLGERPRRRWNTLAVALGFRRRRFAAAPLGRRAPISVRRPGIGLFSGFMAALAYVHVRQLGKLDEPEWRTVFWFAVVGLIGAFILQQR